MKDDPARLSKLLWDSLELIEGLADILEVRISKEAGVYPRSVAEQIRTYRAEQGWSSDGFGGEKPPVPIIHVNIDPPKPEVRYIPVPYNADRYRR